MRLFRASSRSEADVPPLKAFSRSGSKRPREPPSRKGERGGVEEVVCRDGRPWSQLSDLGCSLFVVGSWGFADSRADNMSVADGGGEAEVVGWGFMALTMDVLVNDLRDIRFAEHL